MAITALPTPPSRRQPEATFATNADAFLGALPTFVTEANALQADVNAKQTTASAAATTATTKAGEALASANAAAASQISAAVSAAEAAELVERYQGALASDPTANKTGGPLVAGDWYVNTVGATIRAYTGTGWAQAISSVSGVTSVNGETGDVEISSGIKTFVASGTISTGQTVAITAEGKAEIVKFVPINSGGSPVVFESAKTEYISCCYDSTNGKIVIAYQDNGNSYYGTAIVGTVSGTSISFGSPVVFESANTQYVSCCYDSTNGKIVIAYQDSGNLSYGTACTFQVGLSTNKDFIGISQETVTDAQQVDILLPGGVDTHQSGLEASRTYYLNPNGTLTQTNTGYLAGKALSATELLITGGPA